MIGKSVLGLALEFYCIRGLGRSQLVLGEDDDDDDALFIRTRWLLTTMMNCRKG
jgi:hypothetical protein